MNPLSNLTSNSLNFLIDLFKGRRNAPVGPMQPVAPVAVDGPAVSTAADRMYQIAALTAGIFLLATLL